MSFDAGRLMSLLPEIYGVRDDERGGPLRTLMEVFADQIAVLEENLDQLYDDQFIETCAGWVIPYIGGLIGYRGLHGDVPHVSSPRAEVANTISYRRRKGTVPVLEQVARDVTGCDATVVEYFLRLGVTQYMNHIRPQSFFAPDLRHWEPIEQIGTPFDKLSHTIDVRSIETKDGLFNIPNIGIWLWRLRAYHLRNSPAVRIDDRRFLFSPLGCTMQLFTNPQSIVRRPQDRMFQLADRMNVPAPVSRRLLDSYLPNYYGEFDGEPKQSIALYLGGTLVDIDRIVAADLSDGAGSDWAHKPKSKVAIDPVLGRIAFPMDEPPPADVTASFCYAFAGDLGGGDYERASSFAVLQTAAARVNTAAAIQPAIDAASSGGTVEIEDSGRYETALHISATAGGHLELRSSNEHRPSLVLTSDLQIDGAQDSEVSLNGLVIMGGAIRVPVAGNGLKTLRLRHCTLVPGLELLGDGAPAQPNEPSLVVEAQGVTVEIDHCIAGGLRVADGSNVVVSNSIIDSTNQSGVAFAAADGVSAGGMLQVVDSTIIGKVHTVLLEYASNTIFLSRLAQLDTWAEPVRSERNQAGCVRFSYLGLDSATPRRYHCQPDLEIQQQIEEAERVLGGPLPAAARALIESDVRSWLVPSLTSTRYSDPGYGQLHQRCPPQIREGADDEAEMGVFRTLLEPQRDTNLHVRLDEYLRFGLKAGILYAT